MDNERRSNREIVPFETNRIPDTDLSEGEEMILIHGQEGVRIWGEDGNIVNETEPTTQLVAYGPKSRVVPAGENRTVNNDLEEGEEKIITEGFSGLQLVAENGEVVEEYPPAPFEIEYGPIREEVPFEIVRKANNELEEGQENILTAGKTGLQLVDEEGNATLIKEPITEEIEYGPVRHSLPYETERVVNSDLAEGEETVITSGKTGLELEDEEGNITLVSDPVTEVTEYGPKQVPIPFEVKRVADNDLPEGEIQVVTSGSHGLQLEDEEGNVTRITEPVTEVVEYGPARVAIPFETIRKTNEELAEGEENIITPGETGLELEDEEGNITPISEPVTEVIEYGPIRHEVAFETKRVVNQELAEGEEKVATPGETGLELEDEEENITRVSEPVTEVIEYGPVRHSLPFETERIVNPGLAEGEEKIATTGEAGLELEDEEGDITLVSKPVTEIVEYGPIRHPLPFETERIADPDLAEGEERITTPGREGVQLEDEEGNERTFSNPITQIVKYGPVRIYLPYETVRRVNTELNQGEERIVTEGQEGLRLEDEKGNIIETVEPITEDIEYGPEFKVVPYKTVSYPHLDLEEGDVVPLSKGVNGLELLDEAGNVVESFEPIPQEVAYGPEEEERRKLEKEEAKEDE